jgi:hypothetical protein
MFKRAAACALGLIAVAALAACGGSDDSSTGTSANTSAAASTGSATTASEPAGGDFCDGFGSISDDIDVQVDASDPADLGAAFEKGSAALESIDPPAEIADDWATLTDFYANFGKAFANVDLDDPEAFEQVGEAITELQGVAPKLATASQAIAQYAADQCGVAAG